MTNSDYRVVYKCDDGSYYHSHVPVRPREARQVINALRKAGIRAWTELGNFAGVVQP